MVLVNQFLLHKHFHFKDDENNIDLSQFSYVDTMVTVVDAFNFFNDNLEVLRR